MGRKNKWLNIDYVQVKLKLPKFTQQRLIMYFQSKGIKTMQEGFERMINETLK